MTISFIARSQEFRWEPFQNEIDTEIEVCLLEKGYKKMTYYYDTLLKKDGEWKLFNWAKIDFRDYVLVHVLHIPNNSKDYNFLVIYSKSESRVVATSPPLYDMNIISMALQKIDKKNSLLITAKDIDEGLEVEDYLSKEDFENYLKDISEKIYVNF